MIYVYLQRPTFNKLKINYLAAVFKFPNKFILFFQQFYFELCHPD